MVVAKTSQNPRAQVIARFLTAVFDEVVTPHVRKQFSSGYGGFEVGANPRRVSEAQAADDPWSTTLSYIYGV